MKIAIAYFDHFLIEKGMPPSARRVRDIGRGLVASGHVVSIFMPRRSPNEKNVVIDDLQLCYFGKADISKLHNRIIYWSQLLSHVKQNKIDWIILYNVHIDAFFPVKKLRNNNVKVSLEACDLLSSFFRRDSLIGIKRSLMHKSAELLIPKITDLNIGISKFLINHFKTQAPNTPQFLLPVLVDPELFVLSNELSSGLEKKMGIPSKATVIAYVGGLWKHHGVNDLINAFSSIEKKYPQAHLVIAGRIVNNAKTHTDVEKLVNKLNLGKRVSLPGWVSTDDVISIYSRAEILVLPQIEDESMVAALPTKLAEYAQMGKAIISTNVGDIGLYFRDGKSALLVESGRPEIMAKALGKLIENPELRNQLGSAAKQVAHKYFDYRRTVKSLSDEMIRISNKP